jgi:S1-C subfamily serine protease
LGGRRERPTGGIVTTRCSWAPSLRRVRFAVAALTLAVLAGCGGGDGGTTATRTVDTGSAGAGATGTEPTALEQRFEQVVHDVSPSVVLISTGQSLGSGVVYDGNGNIVTNDHVLGGAKTATVTLSDGKDHQAKLVGHYTPDDLAVIKVDSSPPPAAKLADASKLAVGQIVLAIGNPLGLRSSVTDGIISSLGRTVTEGNGAVIASAVQTSAPINPGNSGGALVNLDGEVVGIPTLAATDPQLGGAQAPGIGFAIPSSTIKDIADQLIATGKVTRSGRAYLGVRIATIVGGPGVVVEGVEKGGPAAKAGIKPGDVILEVNGQPTPNADALAAVLATVKPGAKVKVKVGRADGSTATLDVTLAEAPG